jgi:S1-C subfamily serine protease
VAINDQPVSDHDQLMVYLTGQVVGKKTSIQILRGGQPVILSVIPGERK